jgi:hypothetical protein
VQLVYTQTATVQCMHTCSTMRQFRHTAVWFEAHHVVLQPGGAPGSYAPGAAKHVLLVSAWAHTTACAAQNAALTAAHLLTTARYAHATTNPATNQFNSTHTPENSSMLFTSCSSFACKLHFLHMT